MSSQHFGFSQVPVNPSFRNAAVNSVAVVPLLSHDNKGEIADTHSAKSFTDLIEALRRHSSTTTSSSDSTLDTNNGLLLVVPNSSLTRPGDWRYQETPLKAFHWQHGCQRLRIHDGRPQCSRHAHDRLLNAATTSARDWIDLCPHRRTAAVIGVLNMHDCQSAADLHRACEELRQWAVRYSTPPYAVTAHGRSLERDVPVTRLFVYDSFDEESQKISLSSQSSIVGTSILAFPPADAAHQQMMDLHLNVVVSDLTVAIFRDLEQKIRESMEIAESGKGETAQTQQQQQQAGLARRSISRFVSVSSGDGPAIASNEEEPVKASNNLGISQLAGLVSPNSKLAKESPQASRSGTTSAVGGSSDTSPPAPISGTNVQLSKLPQLLTPLDDEATRDPSQLGPKDADAVRKRDMGRREKLAADLCLLAGSPLDAYERYLKAAELCKTGTMDPLWHASALEGCAAAHIAMAEAGGYSVDEYLENNFQLPEEIMALAREDPAKRQAGKQTLPEVVFALCEEALNILNRHKKLGHLYAELLLKLVSYCAEESEAHLRCRWGEGPGCYAGEQGEEPRWKKTTVSKLKFNPLRTKDGDSMIAINTHNRIKKVCELLNAAASVGPLDPPTRVDVAVQCARICLDGVKPTHWKGPLPERSKLPRKAAYFTVVAAETASIARGDGKEGIARDLWLLGTRQYSRKSNPVDGGGDYGWATLRAFCFDCLSRQGNCELSLEASEQLLSLLGELDPEIQVADDLSSSLSSAKVDDRMSASDAKVDGESDDVSPNPEIETKDVPSARASITLDDADLQEAISSASQFAKNLRASYNNFTAASTFLTLQSKWAEDDPIPPVDVPLSGSSPLSSALVSIKSVWPHMDYGTCFAAQKRCLDRTAALRRAMPTSSSNVDAGFVYGFNEKALPLYVSSAMAIQLEPALELECVQKRIVLDESKQGAMATFFNPYAKKKVVDGPSARVAEDEERAMMITFGNRLTIPLEVQRSQLEFDNNGEGRVKAAALSFVIPAKATAFVVNFPFTVLSKPSASVGSETDADTCAIFEVKGLDLTCFGRSFFLPIMALKKAAAHPLSGNLPESASAYVHRVLPKDTDESAASKPRIEAYSCQPKLQICFAESGAPAEVVTVSLSDGEIFTVPAFRLGNYLGPRSKGKIECLEIFSASVPGRTLFDSNAAPCPEELEAEFVHDLLYKADPPPFKLRALSNTLDVDSINSPQDRKSDGTTIAFQIAAAHNFGEKLPNGATVDLQFRYRGPCDSVTEVWRKRVFTIRIVPAKGPRISSITFRPDQAYQSAFAEAINQQWARSNTEKKWDGDPSGKASCHAIDGSFVIDRVGLDSSVSICSTDTYFKVTVANETRSVLTVTRQDEPAGGFEGSPLADLAVRPGVSATIPIVMPRISRIDEYGNPEDVVAKLVKNTTFVWESHKGSQSGPVKARGYIRIPPACLKDIINRHPSFLSQICRPPCSIDLTVGEKVSHNSSITVSMGQPVNVIMNVTLESWVPKDVTENCSLAMDFRCARTDRVEGDDSRRDFVWAGKLRQKVRLVDEKGGAGSTTHNARIAFCSPGRFVVSACARFSRNDTSGDAAEEIWWAPVAQTVMVEDSKLPAQ